MKKLMIALAAVAVAAVSQAATIAWTSNNKSFCDADKNPTTTMTGGELVLIVMATATDWANATVIPTGAGTSGSGTTTLALNTSSTKLGRVSGQVGFTFYEEGDTRNLIDNGDYLALMWKDSDGNLNQLKYTADDAVVDAVWKVSGLANDGTGLTSKVILMSGNFYAGAVPEPTSAMLLLLGVAGLALRRRRA